MKAHQLRKAKRDVRRAVLALRDAMPLEERARRGARAVERFLALEEVMSAGSLLAFWSFGSEVPTQGLIDELHRRGVQVALPRLVEGDMEARAFDPGDRLVAAALGTLEPADGRLVDPAELDVICTPGVAFDRSGFRIGYGGGYFDRFLASTRPDAVRIGLAFAVQVVDFDLPRGASDLPVDAVVTEDEVLRWEPRR